MMCECMGGRAHSPTPYSKAGCGGKGVYLPIVAEKEGYDYQLSGWVVTVREMGEFVMFCQGLVGSK